MKLNFSPDEEPGFLATRDRLLDRFGAWLGDEHGATPDDADEVAGNAALALDWKWAYADGELGTWRPDDVTGFLLDWCPRKLSVSQSDCVTIPAALGSFMEFLDDQSLLANGSAPLRRLTGTVAEVADEFVAAMGDPSKFGMAKSLFGVAMAEGVDLADPEQLEGWMQRLNDRPEEERRRLLPGPPGLPPAPGPSLPPIAPPDHDSVAESKAAAPILEMFRDLAGFVGGGRKLTQKGNPTLADARALVELLDTGDVVDETIGDRTFRTTTADDLPRLRLIFAWAKKAGVVRVVHGKVIATKRGTALGDDPGASFDRVVDALLAIGPLSSQRFGDRWMAWPDVNAFLDGLSVVLLAAPYAAQGPVATDDIAGMAAEAVLEAFEFPYLDDGQVGGRIGTDVIDIVDAFELAGVVRRLEAKDVDLDLGVRRRRRLGGAVELTPAGIVTAGRLLAEAGFGVPVAGRFADASAVELLTATDAEDLDVLCAELEVWCRRRRPEEAVAELAEAARALDDPALRNLALAAMSDIGAEVAEPFVRGLVADAATRGFALCWLVDEEREDPSALFDAADPYPFVDVLAHRLVTIGPEGFLGTLALYGNHERQIEVIGQLWRAPSTATEPVLAAIGGLHGSKPVVKAARKALFKRRSSRSGG